MLRFQGLVRSGASRARITRCLQIRAVMAPTPLYSEERKPLVVVGSVNADLVLKCDRLPAPGETLAAESLNCFPGGKGANQAAAAAKLEYPTFFVGQVGKDAYAGMLRSALSDCGVDTSLLYTVDGSCGTAVILLQPSGENSIIIVGGANMSEEWQITDEVTQAIQNAGAVLLQREIPEVVNVIFAKIAQSARVPVVLDAGGVDKPLGTDLLSNVTILSPNETELARLTGMPTKSEKQVKAAAEALIHQGVNTVLVKMGAKGSLLVDIHGDVVRQEAAKVLHVEDTTGAGDCFTGALAVALLEGKSYQEAMRFASAAAAVCISRPGAMPSLPSRSETLRELAHSGSGEAAAAAGSGGGSDDEHADAGHRASHSFGGYGGGHYGGVDGGGGLGLGSPMRHSSDGGGYGGYGAGGYDYERQASPPAAPRNSFWD